MASLLLSPARLVDLGAIEALKALFCAHGALGYRHDLRPSAITDAERLALVPLVFGLMPLDAIERPRADTAIKPAIREHLRNVGIPGDELLVDVLKSVCDQYFETRRDPATGRTSKRKLGMADIRARPDTLSALIAQQNGRCAVCGLRFGIDGEPTLDHIIPFRLVGDVMDGCNWQLLCNDCNASKGTYLSALQSPYSLNWVYRSSGEGASLSQPSGETRFVVLSTHRTCSVQDCSASAKTARLRLKVRLPRAIAVADHLAVYCDTH